MNLIGKKKQMPDQQISPRILRPPQAAAYLGVKAQRLAQWRCAGEGPAFVRLGSGKAVGYVVDDLDAWIDSRPRLTRTHDSAAEVAA